MPLPFILGGAAVASTVFGAKKAYDARWTQQLATSTRDSGEALIAEAQEKLEHERERTQQALESLGKTKLKAHRQAVIPFKDAFQKIKKIDWNDADIYDEYSSDTDWRGEFEHIESSANKAQTLIRGAATSVGTGGLLGFATYGTAGLVGSASTGTAISTLSGAAATNATLAWLGGGSLVSGGLGMTAGAAVLGGVITGPMLAVGGIIMSNRADEQYRSAREFYALAEAEVEKYEEACLTARGLRSRSAELELVVTSLTERFQPLYSDLCSLIKKHKRFGKVRYERLSASEKRLAHRAFLHISTLNNLMNTKLIDKDGNQNIELIPVINETKKWLLEDGRGS